MDFNKIVQRARSLLVTPRVEWPLIAAEPASVQALYREYFMILAAIAPICHFLKVSILGYAWHGFRVYRLGIAAGLTGAIVEYVTALAAVYVLAVIVEALAPNFGGESNRLQALKVTGYAYTASWIAGVALIIPGVSGLITFAGSLYSIYLFYLGLPSTMKVSPERATGYTAVVVISAFVLGWIIAVVTAGITGVTWSDSW